MDTVSNNTSRIEKFQEIKEKQSLEKLMTHVKTSQNTGIDVIEFWESGTIRTRLKVCYSANYYPGPNIRSTLMEIKSFIGTSCYQILGTEKYKDKNRHLYVIKRDILIEY